MSRKDVFASLKPQESKDTDSAAEARVAKPRTRPILGSPELMGDTSHSPIGAIGQSLSEINERGRRAEQIEQRLAEGHAVVSLETSLIFPSFVSDRMAGSSEAHESLVVSIREQGQQVPILVRPHPDEPGAYQIAFGHRRLRAIKELGLNVNAVVRNLTDEQLVIAQGQENSERQDLSYIEKARFAERLLRRFPRDVIMSAMAVYKSDLSNMLSVVSRIPSELVDSVGPAPGVGRRSWLELADLLFIGMNAEKAKDFVGTSSMQALPSEERFKALLSHLRSRPQKNEPQIWSSANGSQLAKVKTSPERVEIIIDRKNAPEFAAFVLERLQTLFEQQQSKK